MTRTFAIIVAAGRGTRVGGAGPKQYRLLDQVAILARTAKIFLDHEQIDQVRIIIHRDDRALYDRAMADLLTHVKLMAPVIGGAERQDSVRLGLESLAADSPHKVLVHDAARPFVDHAIITRVIAMLGKHDGAIAALPVFDTIKQSRAPHTGEAALVERTLSRERLWRAQTPQGFIYQTLCKAHHALKGQTHTDDASLCEAAGIPVALVAGSPDNMKITQAEDFGMAEILLYRQRGRQEGSQSGTIKEDRMWEFRTGQGFDVHAFTPGTQTVLCGVSIAHSHTLKGHSDADVGMHALTDAILGAVSEGDIGDHFPPSDPQWRGAPSRIFLEKARDLVTAKGGVIVHCDVTLICEAPKIGPHRSAMRNALGDILRISPDRVSVKATTTERLGFTGREEGIAAMATATVKLPNPDDGAPVDG